MGSMDLKAWFSHFSIHLTVGPREWTENWHLRKCETHREITLRWRTKDIYAYVKVKVMAGWPSRITTDQVPTSHTRDLVAIPNPSSLPYFQPYYVQQSSNASHPSHLVSKVKWASIDQERRVLSVTCTSFLCLDYTGHPYISPQAHTTQWSSCCRVFIYWACSMCQALWLALGIQR